MDFDSILSYFVYPHLDVDGKIPPSLPQTLGSKGNLNGAPSPSQRASSGARKPTCGQTHRAAGDKPLSRLPWLYIPLLLWAPMLSRSNWVEEILVVLKYCSPNQTMVTVNSLLNCHYLCLFAGAGMGVKEGVSPACKR